MLKDNYAAVGSKCFPGIRISGSFKRTLVLAVVNSVVVRISI
jgi:hypothetical protein